MKIYRIFFFFAGLVLGLAVPVLFQIQPSRPKTWWAFGLYVLFFILVMYVVVKWRSGKLEQEKQELERVCRQRTGEISSKNRQLEELSEKLKEIDKAKSRFFANISHEFRTPLTLIMGPLEQMLSACPGTDKEQERNLAMMLRHSRRLMGLINQLLDLSKFESGKMKLQAGRRNIIPFLRGIVDSFQSLALQNKQDLTFHAEAEDIVLYFDAGKLEEVINNLLINAVKFTPAGGKITVMVFLPGSGDDVEISVCDTGPGIPGDQLAHIFNRFYQSDSTSEHHRKGSGIGLAIARELVELHHGRIEVRSGDDEGKTAGAEFIFRLPLGNTHLRSDEMVDASEITAGPNLPPEVPKFYMIENEEGENEPGDEAAAVDVGAGKGKEIILVVEDSADVRRYIREAIQPLYTVAEAKDGGEGIQKAREIIPDLIISDVMMPGADGFELCAVLKKDIVTSHIPLVLLTAKASDESIVRGLETGADDYITKPFNTKILLARIKNLIDLRRQFQLKIDRELTLQPTKIPVSTIDQEFIEDLQKVIDKNISDPEFNVDLLKKKLYMSRPTLYRKIHALTGKSPTEFIRSYRLKKAAQLLEQDFGSVTEVAFEVGFSSRAYFTKCFKEKFHQLPSAFQPSGD